jgi:hypothetical protein
MRTNMKNYKPPRPPECIESENVVLAAMLHDEELRKMFEDSGGGEDCFFSPFNREIYHSIEKQNDCLEILDIKNDLSRNHASDSSVLKLMKLSDIWREKITIPTQEIPVHIKILKQYRNKRKLHAMACEYLNRVYSSNGEWLEVDDWKDPIPFDDYSDLPAFPTEMLGAIGVEMVESVAVTNQVDSGLPASMYLAALSTCLSRKLSVDLRTHNEPVNIYTCPILDSGERKTATMQLMMKPIYNYQIDVKKATPEEEETPIFIVDDITTEALFKVMTENNERMSVISAEGGIFQIMAGKYSTRGYSNFDLYLKAHAGDPCSSHRVGRNAQFMESPSLTMCLAVQHDVINEIGCNPQFRGRGLTGRFLFNRCKPKAGYRIRQTKTISDEILQIYKKHITDLMNVSFYNTTILMTDDAQALWDSFYNETEEEMRRSGKLYTIKDWGSKLAGAVARISGLLHFAQHGPGATDKQISIDTVISAIDIGKYYKQHALAVFGLMGDNPQVQAAKLILKYLLAHKPSKFKGREVLQNKSAFKSMDTVNLGLNCLESQNYIVRVTPDPTKSGRPEAATFRVNPKVYQGEN